MTTPRIAGPPPSSVLRADHLAVVDRLPMVQVRRPAGLPARQPECGTDLVPAGPRGGAPPHARQPRQRAVDQRTGPERATRHRVDVESAQLVTPTKGMEVGWVDSDGHDNDCVDDMDCVLNGVCVQGE